MLDVFAVEKEQHTTSDHRGKGKTQILKKYLRTNLVSGQGGRDARSCKQFAGEPEREKS